MKATAAATAAAAGLFLCLDCATPIFFAFASMMLVHDSLSGEAAAVPYDEQPAEERK